MPKKPRTAKQLANDERLRERAKARKEENQKKKDAFEAPPVTDQVQEVQPDPVVSPKSQAPEGLSNEQIGEMFSAMQREIAELKAKNPQINSATSAEKIEEVARMQGVQQASMGKDGVQGVHFKYSTEKSHYPDPTERLYDLPELKRFALRENFIFRWEVDGVSYEKNGVQYAEPRFTVELFRRIFNDDGTDSGSAALVNRQYQHEDQMTTRMAAMRLDILEKFENFDDLMDEIRFMRFRQWLLDLFSPPKINAHNNKRTTQVIDGKVVEVYDTESITDGESGRSKSESLQRQSGIGSVRI